MNKKEALERLSALEAEAKKLREVIEAPDQKSAKDRLIELMLQVNSIKIDKEKYPTSTFGFKDKTFLFEYDSKNGYLWISWKEIWSVIEKEYIMNYTDIQSLIKIMVEEHFNCKGVTPTTHNTTIQSWVEEHFNCKGVTPNHRT